MINPVNTVQSRAKPALLIVEDHIELAENLYEYFGELGYRLDFARDGLTALHLLATNHYDVVVLDLMLPGVNGFDICQRIRKDLKCLTPVIVMTALGTVSDKEKAFEAGADDYLVKPFELKELLLRINALHRRHTTRPSELNASELHFDPGTLEVSYKNCKVMLSGIPSRIFELLIRSYPNFVDHESLRNYAWGNDYDDDHNSLRTHIYSLRQTLGKAFGIDMIKTVYGRGYRLDTTSGADGDDPKKSD